jgi:hypothetical protein
MIRTRRQNKTGTLIAAGVLLVAGAFAGWLTCAPAPRAETADAAKREETRRAQEITDNVKQGKVGHARALADQFYRDYPNSPEIQNIERLTGYHPRPYGPSGR